MIERTIRFLVVLKNAEKRTKPIMAQIATALVCPLSPPAARLPSTAAQSSSTGRICRTRSAPGHGSARRSLPGKGAVENATKRLRRWICGDTDPNTLSQEELRQLCAGLNATPRKGRASGRQVFRANILGYGHRREKLSRDPKSHLG